MTRFRVYVLAALLGAIAAPCNAAHAIEEQMLTNPWRIRTHGSLGLGPEPDPDRFTYGAQLVIPANSTQGWGPGVDFVQTADTESQRFLAVGLYVEQRMFESLLMSIGAVGYFPTEDRRPVPFGFSSKFAYAPTWGTLSPYAGLRIDQLFTEERQQVFSFDVGLTLTLGD